MIDWSKPVDKTDPKVLAEWAADLRAGVESMRAQGDWCAALDDIPRLCQAAEDALGCGMVHTARLNLEDAARRWYMINR